MVKYNEEDWCEHTECIQFGGKRPKHVRCPKCHKRLIPKTEDAEPWGRDFEPIYFIPRHKKPYSKRPSRNRS